jgi:hypothetical protein
MHFIWKRWRLALIAVLTAFAITFAFEGKALAAEPGESGSWSQEMANGQQVEARGSLSEARNGGYLVDVWRGATNNQVWVSINNGPPFTLGTTATYVSPDVVPYGSTSFMIFHTGTDNNIYYTELNPQALDWWGSWVSIPNQSTTMSVSGAQIMGEDLYLVYRSSTDDRIWGTFYDGDSNSWSGTQNIGGGNSPSAPSVTYTGSTLWAVARGEDNQVWMSHSYDIFGDSWSSWEPQGGETYVQPQIAADPGAEGGQGAIMVSYVDENSYNPTYRIYDHYGLPYAWWSQDITGWQTVNSVALSLVGTAIYAILTGLNGYVYYKQVFSG